MNQYQFLKQLGNIPTPGGDGVRVTQSFSPTALKTTAGLVLTAATAPTIANVETNGIAVVGAASSTALGSFVFEVPKDYDFVSDELKINVLVRSAGTTDVPTITATVYRKRAGAALSAALTVVASTAVPSSTVDAAERTIKVSGNGLKGGDVLTINLVSGAHTTDAIDVYNVEVQYKSGIVYADFNSRTA